MTADASKWKVQIDGGCVPSAASRSEPVASNGTVYVGSSDGGIYALDALTGGRKWRFQTGAGISATPVIDRNSVHIGSWDGRFYAIDIMTGQPKWSFDVEVPVVEGALVHAGKVIFVGGWVQTSGAKGNGLIYALDASTGENAWTFDTLPDMGSQPRWPSHMPVIRDEVAYVANWNAARYVDGAPDPAQVYVHAIDPISGRALWSSALNGAWPSPVAVGPKHVLFTTSSRESSGTTFELHALDSATGQEKWSYKATERGGKYLVDLRAQNVWRPPMLVSDDLVVLSTDAEVIGIDVNTGKQRWSLTEPFKNEPINQIHFGPLVYVVTGDTMAPTSGNLHGIDPQTGKLAWSMRMYSRNRIRAVVDGVLYVSTDILRKSLFAVDGVTGKELETVWFSSPVGSESYSICSGPVRYGRQLLMSTERQSFAGGRPLQGYLYSLAAPAGTSR
jgi:outer membrane protein assembly factor BamB